MAEVDDGLDESAPALQVVVDRVAAAKKGMTVAQIYMKVAAALQSSTSVSNVTLGGESMALSVDAVEDIIVWGLNNGYSFERLTENSPGVHHGVLN